MSRKVTKHGIVYSYSIPVLQNKLEMHSSKMHIHVTGASNLSRLINLLQAKTDFGTV